MEFLQDLLAQIGEFFKGLGGGFESIIDAIVKFVQEAVTW